MRLNLELREWYERIDPEKIPAIQQLAKLHGNSFRKEFELIVKTGQARGWLRKQTVIPGTPEEKSTSA